MARTATSTPPSAAGSALSPSRTASGPERSTTSTTRIPFALLYAVGGYPSKGMAPQRLSQVGQLRIEGIADGVGQEVQAEQQQRQRDPGKDRVPRRLPEVLSTRVEHRAPRWRWRLRPKSEER